MLRRIAEEVYIRDSESTRRSQVDWELRMYTSKAILRLKPLHN